ncbi:MAG: hypothetical protein A2046_13175 [Bacteroidetes bacterium GWA2_30_7]|nr:MAG: hypothetical protein A2046_13175 [Bacteroidetes bacterium GWA2_30_7]
MNKKLLGILLGIIAGIIDVIPMIIQDLSWDACLSAFSMWVVVGFFIASINLRINAIFKGIIVAFLTLLPCAIIIGSQEPYTLIPICITTTILGGLLGILINKISTKHLKTEMN